MLDLSRLSPAQRQAVLAPDGPLLIVAGPGSGKTLVLASLNLAHLPRTRDVHSLSGGEIARIGLAILLLRSPDLLLLDEPTNHLDAASLAWLETYIAAYAGAVVLVSHDRYLLNRAVQRIFELDEHDHHLKKFEGNDDAYQQAKAAERQRSEEAYARYQEQLKELQAYLRETATRVAHNRARRDNEKMGFTFRGEKRHSRRCRAISARRRSTSSVCGRRRFRSPRDPSNDSTVQL